MPASSTPTAPQSGSYAAEAAAVDKVLDEQLEIFRREQDAGEITTCEAAHERVRAMEAHLFAIRSLRLKWFGNGDQ